MEWWTAVYLSHVLHCVRLVQQQLRYVTFDSEVRVSCACITCITSIKVRLLVCGWLGSFIVLSTTTTATTALALSRDPSQPLSHSQPSLLTHVATSFHHCPDHHCIQPLFSCNQQLSIASASSSMRSLNPIQLSILNQIKLEQSSSPPSSNLPTQSSAPSILSSSSSLLRSQARLKPHYVDWEDGLDQGEGLREGGRGGGCEEGVRDVE